MNMDEFRNMSFEQQIKYYEDHISSLEDCRRTGSGDISRLCMDIDNAYQQIALLKIRKMMQA